MNKKNLYRWHRILSLIIALPLVLWAGSGFMHPLMTSIRPQVATQTLPVFPADILKIKVSLQEALKKNNISRIENFRLIHIRDNWFYQVKLPERDEPLYLSADKGRLLPNGDAVYAGFLAREFLSGPTNSPQIVNSPRKFGGDDCCAAATAAALGVSGDVRILAAKPVTRFGGEYKSVNRFLPARAVWFDRDDDLRVYVETAHDRFALAVDKNRERFDRIFGWFHTWTWMDGFGKAQVVLIGLIMTTIFSTSLIGLYLFFSSTSKKGDHKLVKARRWHRFTAVTISLFTLFFSLSGFLHIAAKWKPDDREKHFVRDRFSGNALNPDLAALQKIAGEKGLLSNLSLVNYAGKACWRLELTDKHKSNSPQNGNAMADRRSAIAETIYVNCADGRVILPGEKGYAKELALRLSGYAAGDVTHVAAVTRFGEAYNFADKRLPVWEVGFRNGERWFVETSSGHLASRISRGDLLEGYSFALLHKHHFMDWGGKTVRDISTLFWAGAQIFMVIFGLILFSRIRKQKQKTQHKKTFRS
ncbi:MAG: hypothetical protein INR69_07555 [Mucilaginibacter polytrichastri]|nr:hypothetical protein [Mucilaginibacter polytrichastri]